MANSLPKPENAPGTRWTYADYKNWELEPGERYEVIYGKAYAMSRTNTAHQSILADFMRQFGNFLRGKPCKVLPAPFDVRFFYKEDESDDTIVQPDLSVICDSKKLGKEACRGAPDLIVEIVTSSNSAIEMQRKFYLYHEAGVREYWIVDSENKTVDVHLLGGETIIGRSYKEKDTVQVSVLEGLTIELKPVFAE